MGKLASKQNDWMPGTRLLTLTQFRLSSSSADIRLGHTAEFLLFVCVFVWLSEGFKGSLKMSRSGLESSVSCQRAQWTRSGTVWYPLQFKNGSKCSLTWRLWHQMLSHFYYVLIFDEWTIIWLTQVRKGIQDGTIWSLIYQGARTLWDIVTVLMLEEQNVTRLGDSTLYI